MDDVFRRVEGGGKAALAAVDDFQVAAAVADALFREGAGVGTEHVQEALDATVGRKIAVDGMFGDRTLDALVEVAADPASRRAFLDALAERRLGGAFGGEVRRIEHFRFDPNAER